MTWISIDPGIGGSGVAVWKDKLSECDVPLATFSLRGKTRGQYMTQFESIIKVWGVTSAVIENAMHFKANVRGKVCLDSGSLVKLAQFIGSLEEVCRSNGVLVTLVTPIKWKGQLSKSLTLKRINKLWCECPQKPDHLVDAVAIGYWRLGKF